MIVVVVRVVVVRLLVMNVAMVRVVVHEVVRVTGGELGVQWRVWVGVYGGGTCGDGEFSC